MRIEDYLQALDACMEDSYSKEADIIAEEKYEDDLREELLNEFMWYKHEDYMLWNLNN